MLFIYQTNAEGGTELLKVRDNGTTRPIPEDDPSYAEWVRGGNTAQIEPYVAPPPPDLEELKAAKKVAINAERDRRISAGVLVQFPDGPAMIQTRDERDIRNVNGVAASGLAMLTTGEAGGLIFRDSSDVNHTLTPAQAVQFGFQVAGAIQGIYVASWAHKDAVTALGTREDIEGYDVTTGWPGV